MSSKLSSLLVQDGVVSVKRMEEAFQRQVIFGGSLDTILLEMNVLEEAVLLRYLWASSGIPPADFGAIDFGAAQEQTKVFPQRLAEKYLIAPVAMGQGTLQVLVTDPPDPHRLDELGFMLGTSIEPRIVPEFRLYQALEQIYGVKMPLRYAGLVKRMGPPPVPDLTNAPAPDLEAAPQQIAASSPPQEDTPPGAGDAPAPAAQPTGGPKPAPEEHIGSGADATTTDTLTGWEDPFAGAKPDTLVGVPVHPPPSEAPEAVTTASPDLSDASGSALPPQAAGAPAATPPDRQPSSTKQTALGMPVRDVDPTAQTPASTPEYEPAPAETGHEQQQPSEPAPPAHEPAPAEALQEQQPEPLAAPARATEAGDAAGSQPFSVGGDGAPAEDAAVQGSPSAPPGHQPMPEQPATAVQMPSQPRPAPAPESPSQHWPFDPTPLPFDSAVEMLLRAEAREDIFALLLRVLAGYFEFCAVFTVHEDQAVGRVAIRRGVPDDSEVSRVSIPLSLPSIFRVTVESRGYYFGPIYDEGINFGVLADLGRPVPASAFIMPVLIRNRVVCFVYADDGLRAVAPEIPESLVFISYQVSQAFQRLILRAKRDRYSGSVSRADVSGKLAAGSTPLSGAAASAGNWQAAPSAEAVSARAPQQAGVLADPTAAPTRATAPAPPDSSAVQPAFPPLPKSEPAAPPVAGNAAAETAPPEPQRPPPEPAVSADRAITSVGYYSLSDADIEEDIRGSTSAAGRVVDGVTAGELEAHGPAVPDHVQADESPVRVDSGLSPEADTGPGAEDIWALVDDLEQGGEAGDLAAAALQRLGDSALKIVAFRFPGRLSQDRMGQHGQLPPPSEHGPLLNFMVRIGEPAVPHILRLLDSDNPEVRYYATYLFSELKVPAVLPRLLDRVYDNAPPVRRITIEVFKKYVGTAALNAVLEHLRAELVGPVPFRRQCAAEVLGALRDAPAVPRLIELASDRDPETAEAAQRALLLITKQAFGDSRRRWRSWWEKNHDRHRIEWLIDALGHKESECRFLAAQELHRITGETFGYRFDQDRRDREEAQQRWQRWWIERGRSRFAGTDAPLP